MKFFDYPGNGPLLHFLHANGYPPACYQPLIGRLMKQHHVFGMLLRPLWSNEKPESLNDWNPLSDDLLQFLEKRAPGPVFGVGHSLGGIVTLRAALHEPKKFRALVLIDPVLFPPDRILSRNVLRLLGLGYRLHPKISGALKRRRSFDDLETVFRGYRRREVFRYFDDASLKAYVHGMVKPAPGGRYELAYSPEWEARIYYTGLWRDFDLWRGLPYLKVPALIIRGAETDTFWESAARLVQRKNRKIGIVTLEKSTHLVALEKPQEVFETMQSFLKEV